MGMMVLGPEADCPRPMVESINPCNTVDDDPSTVIVTRNVTV